MEDKKIHNKDKDILFLQYFLKVNNIYYPFAAKEPPSESFCELEGNVDLTQGKKKI